MLALCYGDHPHPLSPTTPVLTIMRCLAFNPRTYMVTTGIPVGTAAVVVASSKEVGEYLVVSIPPVLGN